MSSSSPNLTNKDSFNQERLIMGYCLWRMFDQNPGVDRGFNQNIKCYDFASIRGDIYPLRDRFCWPDL